jgi:hypothetical protein
MPPSNPILMTKFQTISWLNYMRLWKDPPNEYICGPTASKYIYGMYVCTSFCARKFLSFEKLCVHFVPLADFFKTSKISEISECLFVQLSILTDCLLQALIQASQSSAGLLVIHPLWTLRVSVQHNQVMNLLTWYPLCFSILMVNSFFLSWHGY